jgi:DNA-directed RNA polymerase subunit RPC12/RpoP
VERIAYEFACEKLAERAARKGIACPHCGGFSDDYDYVRVVTVSEDGPQSHLVCKRCGEEFGPSDV